MVEVCVMSNQGFVGAVIQYFTIEDKPRLTRRNTWFRDHLKISEKLATNIFVVIFSVILGVSIFNILGLLP